MSTSNDNQTSVMGEAPEITAPVRLEGQSNSEVLFTWMLTNRYVWMLDSRFEEQLNCVVGERAGFHLAYRLVLWSREEPSHGTGHPALAVPESDEARQVAFNRLERVIKHHILDVQTTMETETDERLDH